MASTDWPQSGSYQHEIYFYTGPFYARIEIFQDHIKPLFSICFINFNDTRSNISNIFIFEYYSFTYFDNNYYLNVLIRLETGQLNYQL